MERDISTTGHSPATESPRDSTSAAGTSAESYPTCAIGDPDAEAELLPHRSPSTVKELQLMHHWSTRTSCSFANQFVNVFRDHAVSEAFRHDYLMDALFATTSLHIACEMEDATAARIHVSTALQYQNRTMSGLRKTLNNISPSNCDAILTSAMLMMICAFLSSLMPIGSDDAPVPAEEAVFKLVDFLYGVKYILDLSRPWVVEGPIGTIIGLRKYSAGEVWFPAKALRHLNQAFTDVKGQSYSTFEAAITGLEEIFQGKHGTIGYLIWVEPGYMEKLREGNMVARIIFMHWGVLLYILEDMWWSTYSGRKLVQDLSASLRGQSDELDRAIEWCRTQVGL